jgi:hypothetical protein
MADINRVMMTTLAAISRREKPCSVFPGLLDLS